MRKVITSLTAAVLITAITLIDVNAALGIKINPIGGDGSEFGPPKTQRNKRQGAFPGIQCPEGGFRDPRNAPPKLPPLQWDWEPAFKTMPVEIKGFDNKNSLKGMALPCSIM
jgi:hypothetical protein